ncbi:NUDIX hydrolase [Thalassovita aquimarina]|uniref:NUDIX hydrolase n=1 Tax=Thalassovita aquimarina TaxID=2785917 RepID=A0ABS5HQ92_9RHOB|nr:NUDIX hydrolase [Thalassovita aquimarina]MBR9650981.1 NUDIX hydrolase [Thalassovita aquimarina]
MTNRFENARPVKAATSSDRPLAEQVAALCVRGKGKAKEVLLITSRGTGRWIIPKGWPMKDKSAPQAAQQEAWEEAGVLSGKISKDPIGSFRYVKKNDDGSTTPVCVQVYLLKVNRLKNGYPEAHQRERRWVSPATAAKLVREDELRDLLLSL